MIRKARPEDSHQLAELCYIIWHELEVDVVKHIEKSRLLKAIEKGIVDVKYREHYSHIWVKEIDNKIAGCLIAYSGDQEEALEQAWLDLDLDQDIRQFGTPMPQREANNDEYYIETVVTFPEYRGQGVATQLMDFIMDHKKGEKFSLNCDVNNKGALHIYRKLGFESQSEFDLYGLPHYHMIFQA
ncbi:MULTISPECIES: GNAT family N-acetyltransferase [Staphylococcus]|uniref:GNAT family N-acetyltransferase n=1 Tax=Staphylococcus hsinchuensis TaxID=3051183 RepID=A0ABZ3EBM3_9STAP|nr:MULTISPECIES: GNAT family N-acetyltransferase [unclassified Staphylococcus]